MWPPGYEPGELPTAPLRDVYFAPHFWFASAKVHIYLETHKLSANFLAEKNEFVNEKASFFAKQRP